MKQSDLDSEAWKKYKEAGFGMGKLKCKPDEKPIFPKKIIKPNRKTDNKKFIKSLKIYEDEINRKAKLVEQVYDMGILNGFRDVNSIDILCSTFEEWMGILKDNISKEIVQSDDPKRLLLGFNFDDDGEIKNYYVNLKDVKAYVQRNPNGEIHKVMLKNNDKDTCGTLIKYFKGEK